MNKQLHNESIELARHSHSAAKYYISEESRAFPIQHNSNQEMPTFERQLNLMNMCSTMITVNPNQMLAGSAKKSIKKWKHTIAAKLKRFRQRIGGEAKKTTDSPTLKRFLYKSSFNTQTDALSHCSTLKRRNSGGDLSGVSSYSMSSHEEMPEPDMFPESNLFLFNRSEEISYLFETAVDAEPSCDLSDESYVIRQGPSGEEVAISTVQLLSQSTVEGQTSTPIKKRHSYVAQADLTELMDQSTQLQVDSPVLIESTFDTSSCSNLSSDLIILQTGFNARSTQQPQQHLSTFVQTSINETNVRLINRFAEHNSFDQVPDWALGNNLNLALVNQIYFKQNALFE